MNHPRDLPPEWFAVWEERAAIVQEGCRLPTTREGTAEANRRAFEMILAEIDAKKGGARDGEEVEARKGQLDSSHAEDCP